MLKNIIIPIGLLGLTNLSHCDYDRKKYKSLIGKTLTKNEFYENFPDFEAYKILRSDMIHYDYTYKFGLNEIKKFNPNGSCINGGFYLTDKTNIPMYESYGPNLAKISLPNDTLIYIEDDKIKVNKLYIENIDSLNNYFNNLIKKEKLEAVKKNGYLIRHITNPDKDI
jgi:hypothetical protein